MLEPDGAAKLARVALGLAELLPEACRLLENDERPEAQAWIRKTQRAAIDVITRRSDTEERGA